MGKRLVSLVQESKNLQLVGATETKGHPDLGKDAGDLAGCGHLDVSLTDDLVKALPQTDVVVDFTSPAATLNHLAKAVQHKRAMVIGTTGLSPDEMNQLRKHAESIPGFSHQSHHHWSRWTNGKTFGFPGPRIQEPTTGRSHGDERTP